MNNNIEKNINDTSKIPKLRCFDKNTLLIMKDGTRKKIIDIQTGDMLENNVMVTAKIKVDASKLRMFMINNITVSESHIVKYGDQWIHVREHPNALELDIETYQEPYLYCLNTSNKEIIINDVVFTDWDEIYEDSLNKVIYSIPQNIFCGNTKDQKENIHKYLDKGFDSDTNVYLLNNTKKQIKDINIGDVLSTKGVVYGIVEIENNCILGNNTKNTETKLYHLLVSNKYFEIYGKIIRDYTDIIDSIC